jgi:murein DD-endopeptidase MepM/ murein hydrolase activator NlpD
VTGYTLDIGSRTLAILILVACPWAGAVLADVLLQGEPVQGGLIFGKADPGSQATLDGRQLIISAQGNFVIGFDRDETGQRELIVSAPDQPAEVVNLDVVPREFALERVDGLPPKTIHPDPEAEQRIRDEAAMVNAARSLRDPQTWYLTGFAWPASGRISGVYGSQRILNGEPGRPHYGLDIAADVGSPVFAPADGVITLVHDGMYFSGGTLILDHGQGLSSSFLHLSKILAETGAKVRQGDLIALVGATGRASGPHLDWRMNWLDRRVDPQLLLVDVPQP